MQFQIKSSVLSDVVSRLVAATDDKVKLPKNETLKIEASGSAVRLTAYAGVYFAQAVLEEATVSDSFQVGVSKEMFANIVKSLPEGDVTFKVKDAHAEIKTHQSSFKINIYSDLDLLPRCEISAREYGPLDVKAFHEGLKRVVYCHNDKPLQPYHNMLYVDDELFVSTDGLRMATFVNKAFRTPKSMLLQIPDVKRTLRLLGGLADKGGIGSEGGSVYLSAGGIFSESRLMAGSYPNFRAILPTDAAPSVVTPRKQLLEALRRATLVVTDGICGVDLEFAAGALILSCLSETGSASKEVVPNALATVAGKVRINADFLVDALTNTDKDEVTLEYRGPAKPLVVTDGDHRNVISAIGKQ